MSSRSWYTEKDVIQDLAEVTGRQISFIDNNFFVVGDNPPPPVLSRKEDDLLRLELEASMTANRTMDYSNRVKPDLKGIRDMLRLANESSCDSTKKAENVKICTDATASACDIISISKLDPNVKEFVPKRVLNQADSSKNKAMQVIQEGSNILDSKQYSCIDKVQAPINDFQLVKDNGNEFKDNVNLSSKYKLCNEIERNKNLCSKTEVGISKRNDLSNELDLANYTSQDTQAIATVLKNKISHISASKANTFQARKEKNVALLSLQKLYSLQTKGPEKKTVQLKTPNYFETAKAGGNYNNQCMEKNEMTDCTVLAPKKTAVDTYYTDVTDVEDNITLKLPEPEIINTPFKALDDVKPDPEMCRTECNFTKLKTNSDSGVQNIDVDSCITKLNTSDPQIQNSMQIVINWLNMDEKKPKRPALYLSPVSFKRKQNINRQSPNEVDKKMAKPTTSMTQEFVPSKFATELTEKYINRAKNNELVRENMTWNNLATKLKEKENITKSNTSKDSSLASSINTLSINEEDIVEKLKEKDDLTGATYKDSGIACGLDVLPVGDEDSKKSSKLKEKDEEITKTTSKNSSVTSTLGALPVSDEAKLKSSKLEEKYEEITKTTSKDSSVACSLDVLPVSDGDSKKSSNIKEKDEKITKTTSKDSSLTSSLDGLSVSAKNDMKSSKLEKKDKEINTTTSKDSNVVCSLDTFSVSDEDNIKYSKLKEKDEDIL